MFYIAVCDVGQNLDKMRDLLSPLTAEHLPVAINTFDHGDYLLEAHRARPFHLIFLRVHMAPMSGLDLAKALRSFDPLVPIVFLASSSDHALEGYDVDAHRFFVEPLDPDEILATTRQLFEHSCDYHHEAFTYSTLNGAGRARLEDILYFQSDLRKINMVTRQDQHEFYGTLAKIEDDLAPFSFLRVHKSYVVNLRYVKEVQADGLVLDNHQRIPIAKHRHKEILDAFLAFNHERDL